MTAIAMNNLWAYISTLGMTKSNATWLAERLTEYKSDAKQDTLEMKIEQGRQEILNGDCITCHNKEELHKFLEEL